MSWAIREGDCVEVMRSLDESSVDAVVTDPPYGLEFMGKEWDRLDPGVGRADLRDRDNFTPRKSEFKDGVGTNVGMPKKNPRCRKCGKLRFDHDKSRCRCAAPDWNTRQSEYAYLSQVWHEAWAVEALRVLKPGGHLLAFGGTRTYHRLACALEDAGFEIRDCLAWFYGSGFPKSLDVSKAIDKAAGAEREVVGVRETMGYPDGGTAVLGNAKARHYVDDPPDRRHDITAPATPDAERWQGWGTALKPAFEPIVLARKPLAERNVAANILAHGTGALNVDGTRIETDDRWEATGVRSAPSVALEGGADGSLNVSVSETHPSGRWPANVILDEEAAAMLDEQSGPLHSQDPGTRNLGRKPGWSPSGTARPILDKSNPNGGDRGGASRFFYTAKTSRAEREVGRMYGAERNDHPTVKPVDLMQWLCRLVTPPGGLVLDPFTGSGSTGIAALREGFNFLGIEREPNYVEIARARIQGDSPLFNLPDEAKYAPAKVQEATG